MFNFDAEAYANKEMDAAGARREALKSGARLSELMALFRISDQTARTLFASTVRIEGRPGRESIFSRAEIVELLAEWNGRAVPFPTEPYWTTREAAEFLGMPIATLTWNRTRRASEQSPRFIRVGPTLIRYALDDVYQYALGLTDG